MWLTYSWQVCRRRGAPRGSSHVLTVHPRARRLYHTCRRHEPDRVSSNSSWFNQSTNSSVRIFRELNCVEPDVDLRVRSCRLRFSTRVNFLLQCAHVNSPSDRGADAPSIMVDLGSKSDERKGAKSTRSKMKWRKWRTEAGRVKVYRAAVVSGLKRLCVHEAIWTVKLPQQAI